MEGVVQTRDLFTQSPVIVREFGIACLARCLWRALFCRHTVTFLECAVGNHS
jgi:hypothetical protein